ncbi:TetR/AcrR family transcriptional regulator [Actinocrispum wychmicini]|uniref:TetR family transcriptional regulator n=1 Tax=Actinocrispum wychmicini TaxID=1213861 RepID=A0A4R2JRN4_9PSEU|nr:TetR/AcrR family transcriptional regulator [Actinocrispum wychmicini]TCO59519.1 TetR family transcriptional regulator [Actinocrispum wychmicini]
MARLRNPKGQGRRLRDEIIVTGQRLLAAAVDERQFTVRAVADAVGVTMPSVYMHFPTRAALLSAITERGFGMFDHHLTESIARVQEPAERIRGLGRAYLEFAATHPGLYRVVFSIGPAKLGAGDERASFVALVDAAAACVPEIDARDAAIWLWSVVHGLANLRLTKPDFDWPATGPLIDEALNNLCVG